MTTCTIDNTNKGERHEKESNVLKNKRNRERATKKGTYEDKQQTTRESDKNGRR